MSGVTRAREGAILSCVPLDDRIRLSKLNEKVRGTKLGGFGEIGRIGRGGAMACSNPETITKLKIYGYYGLEGKNRGFLNLLLTIGRYDSDGEQY
jgi:hypothetical protein